MQVGCECLRFRKPSFHVATPDACLSTSSHCLVLAIGAGVLGCTDWLALLEGRRRVDLWRGELVSVQGAKQKMEDAMMRVIEKRHAKDDALHGQA